MPKYANGFIPQSYLIVFKAGWNAIDGNWQHSLTPASYARHKALVAVALARTGRELKPSEGWSCYRPYSAQVVAKDRWGIGAATPGTSSHGGIWEGKQTMATDYGNWAWVYANHGGQDAFFEDARSVGLSPGLIMKSRGYPNEPWHIIDLNPWSEVPTFAGILEPEEVPEKEDQMKIISNSGGAQKFADELGADDIGQYFYVPAGGATWEDNIRAAWLLAGNPEPAANDAQYELARHQANARWDQKRGQIVSDTVAALKPFLSELGRAIAGIKPERFEELIKEGLKDIVVEAGEISDEDKREIAQATRDIFRADPLK